jgi:hypothetical protein
MRQQYARRTSWTSGLSGSSQSSLRNGSRPSARRTPCRSPIDSTPTSSRSTWSPLRFRGKAAVADQTRAWFDAYESDIGYEVRELHATADGDLGFCSFLYHVSGTLAAGGEVEMWVRATLCCRRIDGR